MTREVLSSIADTPGLGDRSQSAVVPFLVGTAVGGVAGAVVGTLLGGHATHLIAALIHVVDRRADDRSSDRLKFELLLQ